MKKVSLFLLSGLLALGAVQAQRSCGVMEHLDHQLQQDPQLLERMGAIEEHTQEYIRNNPNGERVVVTIPVVFHVIYNTTTGNISDNQIQSQLDVLNADFRKLNADASLVPSAFASLATDCEIQFCLAKQTPTGAATTGIQRRQTTVTSFSTNDAMKYFSSGGLDAWDRNKYLNFWVCTLSGGILGYAQFPGGTAATDGVVCDYRYVGTIGTATAPFNKGRTATHEVGHWLNLRHIWGDANCGNDLVGDTPTHNTANYGCPAYPHYSTCSGAPVEMTMNYMDYTDDACMYMFSAGQKARMQALFASGGARASLLTSNGCTTPSGGGTTCGTPTGVSVASVANTSAVVSWAAVSGASSYNVTVGANTYNTTATSYTLSGLAACTGYSVTVSAVCGTTTSAASSAVTFTTTGCTSCTDSYETNNTSSTAKSIALNTNLTALISTSTDADWYVFTTTNAAPKVKVELFNLPADYDVRLYASNGTNQLGISQNGGTTSEIIKYNTPNKGATYRIRVYGYNGAFNATACYGFRVSTSASNWRLGEEDIQDGIKELVEDMTVYPNPTDGIAYLQFNDLMEDANLNINVIDQTGRTVFSRNAVVNKTNNELELDFSSLTEGVYFIQIYDGEGVKTKKIVVNK